MCPASYGFDAVEVSMAGRLYPERGHSCRGLGDGRPVCVTRTKMG